MTESGSEPSGKQDVPAPRFRLRPATGSGVIAAVLLGALPAALIGLESAWLVVALGLAFLIVAPLASRRQVQSITRVHGPARLRVHAGRTTPATFEIESHTEARGLLIDLDVPGSSRPEEGSPRLAVPLTGAHGTLARERITIPVRLGTRGRYTKAVARVSSSFPFAMAHATRSFEVPLEITVLPRRLAVAESQLTMSFARSVHGSQTSNEAARWSAPGLPLGLRDARPGDRLRDIDARASLSKGRWIAYERGAPRQEQDVEVGVCLRVRGASAASRRRHHLAFEAAVAHCACAVALLTRESSSVCLTQILPDQGALDESLAALIDPGAIVARTTSSCAEPLLDELAVVRLGASAGTAANSMAPTLPRSAPPRRLIFVPMAPLDFQRLQDQQAERRRRLDLGSETWVIGVEGGGRALRLDVAMGSGSARSSQLGATA